MIPTAEEFFRQKLKQQYPLMEVVILSNELITAEQGMIWSQEYSIIKSEYHVRLALEKASNDVFYTTERDSYRNIKLIQINKASILNAYPTENIK